MSMFTITMLQDREGLNFYTSYTLFEGNEYLAERTSIDSLRVYGQQFADGHVIARNMREGRDFVISKRFSCTG